MKKSTIQADKIYTTLCVLFAVLIVVNNLVYQKFVSLPILSFYTFELSVGALLYPLTFLLTDLITEFYGKNKASFCIKLAIAINITTTLSIILMDKLDATEWSKIDNIIFHKVFGLYGIAFIASIIACYIAQFVDIKIYLWIRQLTRGKWLWLRNNGSTAISLLVDTCTVVSIMTVFGVLPKNHLVQLIIHSYLFKLFFTICSTPIFYLGYIIIQKIIQSDTSANPNINNKSYKQLN